MRVVGRVLPGGIEAGAVDGILGARSRLGGGVTRCDDVRDRIGQWLGGKAPDIAFEDRVVRRGVDLIDAPVVGLPEVQHAGGIVARTALALTDQRAQRIGLPGRIDVVERRAKIHIMRRRKLPRLPLEHHIPRHIALPIRRNGVTRKFDAQAGLHGLSNLRFRQGHVVNLHVIHQSGVVPGIERVCSDGQERLRIQRACIRVSDTVVKRTIDVNADRPGRSVPNGRDVHPIARDDVTVRVHGGVWIPGEERQFGAEDGDDEVIGCPGDVRPK